MQDVHVIDKKTGKAVTVIPVQLGGMGYTPGEKELFDTAWEAAVSDMSVEATRRDDYSFEAVPSKS